MKLTKFFVFLAVLAVFAACQKQPTQLNPGGYTGTDKDISNSSHKTEGEHEATEAHLTEVERPQKIQDMTASRGNQDKAAPTLNLSS